MSKSSLEFKMHQHRKNHMYSKLLRTVVLNVDLTQMSNQQILKEDLNIIPVMKLHDNIHTVLSGH